MNKILITLLFIISFSSNIFPSEYFDFTSYLQLPSIEDETDHIKDNIYSFMNLSPISKTDDSVSFAGSGLGINDYKSDLIPLLFDVNGDRVETLWGYDHGNWRILEINVNWNQSFIFQSDDKPGILEKIVRFSPGPGIAEKLDTIETEEWSLEFGLERSFFENLGIEFGMGLNNLVDDVDPSIRSYQFESRIRAKLHQSFQFQNGDITLSFHLTGGAGFEANLSKLMDEKEFRIEAYTFDDYYSFPILASAGFELSYNTLNPRFVVGMELNYEYVKPFSSFFEETENEINRATFLPTAYVKWVY